MRYALAGATSDHDYGHGAVRCQTQGRGVYRASQPRRLCGRRGGTSPAAWLRSAIPRRLASFLAEPLRLPPQRPEAAGGPGFRPPSAKAVGSPHFPPRAPVGTGTRARSLRSMTARLPRHATSILPACVGSRCIAFATTHTTASTSRPWRSWRSGTPAGAVVRNSSRTKYFGLFAPRHALRREVAPSPQTAMSRADTKCRRRADASVGCRGPNSWSGFSRGRSSDTSFA